MYKLKETYKAIVLSAISIENSKTLKYFTFSMKH